MLPLYLQRCLGSKRWELHRQLYITCHAVWNTSAWVDRKPGHVCTYSTSRNNQAYRKGPIRPEELIGERFTKFYVFPYIMHVRFLSRLKLYQTGVTVTFLPLSTYMYSVNLVSLWNVQAGFSAALFACAMLYVMSGIFQRTVGMLSFNDKEDIVRLSYLSFFGARKELYLPLDGIVPLSELPDDPSDIYVKFTWEGARRAFYLSIKYGHIVDKDKFRKVLGVKSV